MLAFFACLVCLVGLAVLINRLGGARAHYIETFELEADEQLIWRDDEADAYAVPKRRAVYVSYRRSHRSVVVVTSKRIVVATRVLLGSRHMLGHMLYPADRTHPPDAEGVSGGLFSRGYVTLLFERAPIQVQGSGDKSFVELQLNRSVASSDNLDSFRIYSSRLNGFDLPS